MNFNEYKDSYSDKIQASLSMSGQEHDFFLRVKAEYLQKIITRRLPSVGQIRLLDIGCGHGLMHKFFDEKKMNVVGVEVAEEVLELARQSNPHVSYIAHDGHQLPAENGQFDVSLAVCVMHHVTPEHWENFLVEMKRVTRKDGIAVIFEHNPFNPVTRYIVSRNELDADAVLLSNIKLTKLMKKVGFKQVKTRSILFTPFGNPLFRKLDELIGLIPLGAQYYVEGQV